jgi:hypothetical protein
MIYNTVALTMTPAIELRNTEYADRYDVKLLLLLRRFQGNMQSPTVAAMYPPRRIFCEKREKIRTWSSWVIHTERTMKRGHKEVRSQPALTELADIFVLSASQLGMMFFSASIFWNLPQLYKSVSW